MFEAGRGLDESCDVGVPPPGGRCTDQDAPEHGRGIAAGSVLAQRGRARCRQLAAATGQVQVAVLVERQRHARVGGFGGLVDVDELRQALDELTHLGGGRRGARERVQRAGEHRGGTAGTVRCSWGPHTARNGVRELREVERGAQVAREARQGGDRLGVDALGQGRPYVAAAGRAGLADDVLDAGIREEAGDRCGVALGRGVRSLGLRVEVERQQPEPGIGAGEVDRPRPGGLRPVDAGVAGVEVQHVAAVVDGSDAHARARAQRARERPRRNAARALGWVRCARCYDGVTSLTWVGRSPGLASRFFHSNRLGLQVAKLQQIRREAFSPRPAKGGG